MSDKLQKLFYVVSIGALLLGIYNSFQIGFGNANLEFQNLPTQFDLNRSVWSGVPTNEFEFQFFIYNYGSKTAFIRILWINFLDENLSWEFNDYEISHRSDFAIEPNKNQLIKVKVFRLFGEDLQNFKIVANYNDRLSESQLMTIYW